jgi:DNA repair protein RecN (Recombination protein N)
LLSEIRIKKFLYLKDIEISLSDRLNVFTGETGVGKSLIIDAISFVLGERGSFEENDYVELMFEADNQYAEDGILILARQVKNGKNIYYLNGRKVVKSIIDEISQNLIEIHGQHASQKLFDADYQREIFDKFAKVEDKLGEFQKLYSEYIKVKKEYEDILSKQAENQRKIDFLTFQINELSSANIKPGKNTSLKRNINTYQI